MSENEIRRLRKLAASVPQAKWKQYDHHGDTPPIIEAGPGDFGGYRLHGLRIDQQTHESVNPNADARLIAALLNAAPALLHMIWTSVAPTRPGCYLVIAKGVDKPFVADYKPKHRPQWFDGEDHWHAADILYSLGPIEPPPLPKERSR